MIFWRTSEFFSKHRLAEGKIGKVRVIQPDTAEALAVLDFSLTNDTDHDIVIRSLQPAFDQPDGTEVAGRMIAATDIDRLFGNFPELGAQFNPPLKAQDILPRNATIDRMAVVSFDVPESAFKGRKDIVLRVDTAAGIAAELRK